MAGVEQESAGQQDIMDVSLLEYIAVAEGSEPSRQAYVKFVEGKSPEEVRWWSKDTVAVVTGANKGIGLEVVRQLAKAGVTTILTARDESKGVAAADSLKAQGLQNVFYHQLEISNPDSIANLASWIKEKFGGLDILVNNAAIGGVDIPDDFESATAVLGTNYTAQKLVTAALLPLLKPSAAGARIVFVSSEFGQLKNLNSEEPKQKLLEGDRLTEQEVDALGAKYLDKVKKGQNDWVVGFAHHYKMSKALLNGYARQLAKSLSDRSEGKKVYVNMMGPGLTSTDMTLNTSLGRTVENGADTAVWIALFPSGGPQGKFLRDRADYSF